MIEGVVARLSEHKPLFASDELAHDASLLAEVYHEKVLHEDLDYATVHKTRKDGRVAHGARKIVFGDPERIGQRLEAFPSRTVNTSCVERFSATPRRKSLTFAKALRFLKAKFALIVTWYSLVRPRIPLDGLGTHRPDLGPVMQ